MYNTCQEEVLLQSHDWQCEPAQQRFHCDPHAVVPSPTSMSHSDVSIGACSVLAFYHQCLRSRLLLLILTICFFPRMKDTSRKNNVFAQFRKNERDKQKLIETVAKQLRGLINSHHS
ncbi:hypothetical protein GDO78_018069 [Eleutherodactylus coqui]|uniref:Uncharacterized protein n=1 Tax=Eleutherodactylus coqui TaxID=57060 RepID=A0A8J6BL00_ELECQ|nr:hypothetical protein GDO78_018069 [Eleutherodactylus coqui]